jgi:hypothetical protein
MALKGLLYLYGKALRYSTIILYYTILYNNIACIVATCNTLYYSTKSE